MYATHTKTGRKAIQETLDTEQTHCRARLMTLDHIDRACKAIHEFKTKHSILWEHMDGAEFAVTTHIPSSGIRPEKVSSTSCLILVRDRKYYVLNINRTWHYASQNVQNGFIHLNSYARDAVVRSAIDRHSYTIYS